MERRPRAPRVGPATVRPPLPAGTNRPPGLPRGADFSLGLCGRPHGSLARSPSRSVTEQVHQFYATAAKGRNGLQNRKVGFDSLRWCQHCCGRSGDRQGLITPVSGDRYPGPLPTRGYAQGVSPAFQAVQQGFESPYPLQLSVRPERYGSSKPGLWVRLLPERPFSHRPEGLRGQGYEP